MSRVLCMISIAALALASVAADEPPEPKPEQEIRSFEIVEVRAVVADKMADGDDWDEWPRKAADPQITVRVDGVLIKSCLPQPDQHDVQCYVGKDINLSEKSTLTVTLTEFDTLTEDDPIGTATLADPFSTAKLGAPIELKLDGQLTTATITFGESESTKKARKAAAKREAEKKKAEAKAKRAKDKEKDERKLNMWDASRYRLIGLGTGVAVGLLMAWLLGAFLWPPEDLDGLASPGPRDVVKVRCPFCGALNGETDDSCHKCDGSL